MALDLSQKKISLKVFFITISVILAIAVVMIIVFYLLGKNHCNINGKITVETTTGAGIMAKLPLATAPAMASSKLEITSPADCAALANGTGKYGGKACVMIYSNGCGHCKTTKPAFEEASLTSKVPFYMADISKFRTELDKYKVSGIPHIILLDKGKEVAKYSGDRSASSFVAFANKETMPSRPFQ